MEPKHFIKLLSKHSLTNEEKEEFISLVKAVDSSVDSYYEDSDHKLIIELVDDISDEALDRVFNEYSKNNEDFFIMCSNKEDQEEEKPVEENLKEDSTEKEAKSDKEELKDLYKQMCEELEVRLHNRVIDKKSSLGWKYGDKFDPHKKESPLMKPYHELPSEYQTKNGKVFSDVIDILRKHGFTVSLPKKHHL